MVTGFAPLGATLPPQHRLQMMQRGSSAAATAVGPDASVSTEASPFFLRDFRLASTWTTALNQNQIARQLAEPHKPRAMCKPVVVAIPRSRRAIGFPSAFMSDKMISLTGAEPQFLDEGVRFRCYSEVGLSWNLVKPPSRRMQSVVVSCWLFCCCC